MFGRAHQLAAHGVACARPQTLRHPGPAVQAAMAAVLRASALERSAANSAELLLRSCSVQARPPLLWLLPAAALLWVRVCGVNMLLCPSSRPPPTGMTHHSALRAAPPCPVVPLGLQSAQRLLQAMLQRLEDPEGPTAELQSQYGGSLRELLGRQPECERLTIMGAAPEGALHALLRCAGMGPSGQHASFALGGP